MNDETHDPRATLGKMLSILGVTRTLINSMERDIAQAQEEVEQTEQWRVLNSIRTSQADSINSARQLEKRIREIALEIAEELDDPKPAPGIHITAGTFFRIDDPGQAIAYCAENYPQLIVTSLDKAKLQKIVTALGVEHGIPGVTLEIKPYGKVRIATDLSKATENTSEELVAGLEKAVDLYDAIQIKKAALENDDELPF